MDMRLQRYIASSGICSRRAAERLILNGQVKINGQLANVLGQKILSDSDIVTVSGREVRIALPKLFIFHKPTSVISTMRDTAGRMALSDFIAPSLGRLFSIGRLDYDVSGLMLLTNDGDFANSMMHPRYAVSRVYEAKVSGIFKKADENKLFDGVSIGSVFVKVRNIVVIEKSRYLSNRNDTMSASSFVRLTVAEGSKHLVKKLFIAVGHPVLELCRVSFGPYNLGNLRKGELKSARFISNSEI